MNPNPILIKVNDRSEARDMQTVIDRFIELNGNTRELKWPESHERLDSEVIIRVSNAFRNIQNSESSGVVAPEKFFDGIKVCYFRMPEDPTLHKPINLLQRYFFDPDLFPDPGSLILLSSEEAYKGVPGKNYSEYRLEKPEFIDTNILFDPRNGQAEYSIEGPLRDKLMREYEQDDFHSYDRELKEPLTCKKMFEVTEGSEPSYFKVSDFFREGIYVTDFADEHLPS